MKPIAYEFKHATYVENQHNDRDDLLVIKEIQHFEDGSTRPFLRLIENMERPFWVTHKGRRDHEQKREWEHVSKLQKYKSTQRNLPKAISRALGRPNPKANMRQVCRSPYVYGADVTPAVLMKHHYKHKWPNRFTQNRVAVLDIETNMEDGSELPIMVGVTCKDQAHLFITESYSRKMTDPIGMIQRAYQKYLPMVISERKTQLHVHIGKDDGEICKMAIEYCHQLAPDIVTGWNLDYDITHILRSLESHGYSPATVFSDPKIPPQYHFCHYKKGPTKKTTSSGMVTPIAPAEQWHTLIHPASWTVIDAMCTYCHLRIAKGKEPSYALDYILSTNLGEEKRKLKFDEAKMLEGTKDWHAYMQTNHPAEYAVYCIWDCIGVEELDEKTNDLGRNLNIVSGYSEYSTTKSQPRQTWDDLYFERLAEGYVTATTSDQLRTDEDELTQSLDGIIMTLPSFMAPPGRKLLKELPNHPTNIYTNNADADSVSSYPSCTEAANLSRETTKKEMIAVEGLNDEERLNVALDLTGGFVNAAMIARGVLQAPRFSDLLSAFERDLKNNRV